jgi:hypothetical protein
MISESAPHGLQFLPPAEKKSLAVTLSETELPDATPPHPLGVKPSGNGLTASWTLRSAIGYLQILPDELILILLETLESADLRAVGATCKALYAFTRSEELWKALFIE